MYVFFLYFFIVIHKSEKMRRLDKKKVVLSEVFLWGFIVFFSIVFLQPTLDTHFLEKIWTHLWFPPPPPPLLRLPRPPPSPLPSPAGPFWNKYKGCYLRIYNYFGIITMKEMFRRVLPRLLGMGIGMATQLRLIEKGSRKKDNTASQTGQNASSLRGEWECRIYFIPPR